MLENLFNLIKQEGTEAVINNPAIPNEKNDAVIADATHSVADGLQGVLANGGLTNILSLFGNNNAGGNSSLLDNPIVSSIIGNFTNKLTNNHGIQQDQANGIAGSLIPNIIGSLVNKTNDPNNNSFDINSIIGALTGGANNVQTGGGGFDFGSLVSKFAGGGLDANNDGHVGLDDIISKVTGGAQQQQQQAQNSGGGLMDMIQGFLK
ncbi:hypothetical protein LK994_05645 [Ferruginibacter lapsinanis]|uniref:hypothetical protein n=1 Tax=Ferruginibacter lapsinanis TaxID=563172 RepID=UPI001E2AFCA1|nr:hypothetical protein [Ferruginibacter lapsinanis]UEG50956.1 hypothetical protein LK994_05645 [Ferruginibacter lapsinanis]